MKFRAFAAVVFAASVLAQVRGPAPAVGSDYEPEHSGAWTMVADFVTPSPRSFGANAAQTSALSARIAALAEVVHRTPVLNAPRGVDIRARARYYPYEAWFTASGSCTNYEAPCSKVPLMADLTVTLFNFFRYGKSVPQKIITNVEDNSDILFFVNVLSKARGAPGGNTLAMPDGRPTGLKPLIMTHAAGFPVYKGYAGDNEAYLYFTNGRPPWVPVTREQFITAVIRSRENDVEKQRAAMRKLEQEQKAQLAGRDERIREYGKVLEQTEKDPARREKLLQDAVKLAAIMEEGVVKALEDSPRQLAEMERQLLGRIREEFARMPPSERALPAWYVETPDGSSGLTPAVNQPSVVAIAPEN